MAESAGTSSYMYDSHHLKPQTHDRPHSDCRVSRTPGVTSRRRSCAEDLISGPGRADMLLRERTELTRRNGHVQPAIWLPLGARSELPQSCLFCCDRAYTCVSGRKEWCVQLQFLPMIDRPRYGSRRAWRRGLMPSSPVPSILVQTQPAGIVHGQRRCIAST